MIFRTSLGKSFKGVGQYVLHDKGAQSAERVDFIETENLSFDDGQRAIAEMIHTATNQKALRRRAGERASKTNNPVYHLSMSWETSETPSLKEQMEAARGALKSLGLEDRQALIVGHTDTDNPHIHVVVNLVHPETGETAKLNNDHLKLSKWGEKYRADRGEEHLCPQRAKNNERRSKGEFVKANNMTRQEYEAWKKDQAKQIWDEFRADKAKAKPARQAQYDGLWRQKEERIAQSRQEIKAYYKPQWRDLFKRQRAELKNFDAGFFDRVGFAFSRKNRSKLGGLLQAITGDGNLRLEFMRKQEAERRELGDRHKGTVADAAREVTKAYKFDRANLIEMHQQQDQEAYQDTKAKSAAIFEDKTLSPTGQDFEQSKDRRQAENDELRRDIDAMSEGQKAHIEEARRIQKEIAKENRKRRKRSRKRDRGGRDFEP